MAVAEFLFALDLSDDSRHDRMLLELAAAVFRYAGVANSAADELAAALRGALHDVAAGGSRRCGVRFLVHDGELQMIVSRDGGAEWHTKRALP